VREADRPVRELDDVVREGWLQRAAVELRRLDPTVGAREQQGRTRRVRQGVEPSPHERLERLRDRERLR
jgi:hypothetical protein